MFKPASIDHLTRVTDALDKARIRKSPDIEVRRQNAVSAVLVTCIFEGITKRVCKEGMDLDEAYEGTMSEIRTTEGFKLALVEYERIAATVPA